MVVEVLLATLLVNVIPGLAKMVLAWLAERGAVQDPSKYNVTVEASDVVPSTVGVSTLFGLFGVIDENVTVGAMVSIVTVLSMAVDAAFWLPYASVTVEEAIDGMSVPEALTVVADSVQVILSDVAKDQVIPDAVPFCTISAVVKLDEPTAFEKTTVKLIGATATGSA
jgi:hypothetical protein